MFKTTLIFTILFVPSAIFAQFDKQKYWIIFKDKPVTAQKQWVSDKCLNKRKLLKLPLYQNTDIPLCQTYLDNLKREGIEILIQSKWLNAVSAFLDENQVKEIQKKDFVLEISPILFFFQPAFCRDLQAKDIQNYSLTLAQMQAEALVQAGLTGKDISVGIIDAGFGDADKKESLSHIFKEKRLQAWKDFVNPKNKKIYKAETYNDWHGAEVWTMIAGFDKQNNTLTGLARNAHFYLARTDHGIQETRSEEDNWIAAVEWMDSLGVRVINTSLGYAQGFTNPAENYKPEEMNGKSTKISRAAQIASEEKGLILVVSAGNEGDNAKWQIISAPADSKGVVSVGATKSSSRSKIFYSSLGAEFLPYLKPNISCNANLGTSFSAPVITGLVACLLEKKPSLSNQEILEILEKSAHLYPYGNNYIGYGIPQADILLKLIENPAFEKKNSKAIKVSADSYTFENLSGENYPIVLFHKKNSFYVVKQSVSDSREKTILLQREQGIQRITLDLQKEIVEIVWE